MSILAQLYGAVKYIVKKADMVLLGFCLISTIYGIVLIASATRYTNSYRDVIVQGAAAPAFASSPWGKAGRPCWEPVFVSVLLRE